MFTSDLYENVAVQVPCGSVVKVGISGTVHDLEVVGSNPGQVEHGVCGISV